MTRSRKFKIGVVTAIFLMAMGVYFFFFTAPRELKIDAMALAGREAILQAEKANVGPDGMPLRYGYVLCGPSAYIPGFACHPLTNASLMDRICGSLFGPPDPPGLDDRNPQGYDHFEFDASELRSRVADLGVDLLDKSQIHDAGEDELVRDQNGDIVQWPSRIRRRNDTGQRSTVVLVTLIRCTRYSATLQVDYHGDGEGAWYTLTRRPGQSWQIAKEFNTIAFKNLTVPPATQPTSGPANEVSAKPE